MPDLPLVGDEFAGYRLRAVLGRGGMSTVFQAENPRLGNVIALKVMAPELASDDIFRTRFLEESRIAASMNHPNVIPIHDMGASDGLLYIVMRYVTGSNLQQMIKKRGRLQPETAVFLLSQAARALDAAHAKGLVHRDVKPANLLVEQSNDDTDPDHLYLADFGITKRGVARTGLTSTGEFMGTVDYVAPEQIKGMSVVGMADQYSLGCVLYECLTGRLPFEKYMDMAVLWAHVQEEPTQPTLLRPDLPPAVDDLFARVLAKQPGDRYRDCREFVDAARAALGVRATAPSAGHPATVASAAPPPAATPTGHPVELTHEAEPSAAGAESMLIGAAPSRDNTLTSHRRQPSSAPPGGADDGPGGGPPPGGPGWRRGWTRSRWLVLAAALVLIAGAGGGAYAALSGGSAAKPKAGAGIPVGSAMARGMPAQSPKQSTLMTVLTNANNDSLAKGKLPPASCKQESATVVTCTAPSPGVAQATFTTYPTLTALYAAYEAKVKSVNSGQFQQNVEDCGLIAPSPLGEVGWNHNELHPRTYTVAEMAAGKVPYANAAGRVACVATANASEDIIWTDDIGNMLGVATGSGPVASIWYWWVAVHHWILFPGTPSMASMNSCSVAMAQATGCSVSSMPEASASPSMGSSTMPSSQKPASQSMSP